METIEKTCELLKANLLRMVPSTMSLDKDDFEDDEYPNEGETSIGIRHLGYWASNPYEQDYDWLHLEDTSVRAINSAVEKTSKESGREITWSQEEKCWIYFSIKN